METETHVAALLMSVGESRHVEERLRRRHRAAKARREHLEFPETHADEQRREAGGTGIVMQQHPEAMFRRPPTS